MFEKEADKWVIDYVCKDCSRYEKCKSKEHCTCKECSKEKWQKGAEFGYNKANEWQYVKDGLPEELHDVLCFVIHNEHRFVFQGYLRDGRWVLSPLGTYFNNDDVIAWKEIVLPKMED